MPSSSTAAKSCNGSPVRRAARCAERSQFAGRSHWHREDCVAPSEANRGVRSRPRRRKPVVPKTVVAPHQEVARQEAIGGDGLQETGLSGTLVATRDAPRLSRGLTDEAERRGWPSLAARGNERPHPLPRKFPHGQSSSYIRRGEPAASAGWAQTFWEADEARIRPVCSRPSRLVPDASAPGNVPS